MSIAEKLLIVAENMQTIKEKINNGSNSSVDLIQYAFGTNLFRATTFPDEITNIDLYLPTQKDLSRVFYYSKANNLQEIKIKGNNDKNAVNIEYAFWGCPAPIIDFSEYNLIPSKLNYAFAYWTVGTEIKGSFDLSQCTTVQGAFSDCLKLAEVRFKEGTIKLSIDFGRCSLLSADSRQSIIDGLADLTGSDKQTISFNSETTNLLTKEQMLTIWNKNWNTE